MKCLKKLFLLLLLTTIVFGCNDSKDDIVNIPQTPVNPDTPNYKGLDIYTDKAAYAPGETVVFSMENSSLQANAKVRYKHLNKVLAEVDVNSPQWTWKAPSEDFTGYVAEVYATQGETETIYATIGIDVSSSWTKFPRYGFLSHYGIMPDSEIQEVIDNLSRHHINGVQFYDWHNKHHQPLPLVGNTPAASWKDIMNKDVYLATVEKYIAAAHDKNMKAMFYNLIFGAWAHAETDGVKKEWYVYKDNSHTNQDFHHLSSPPFLSSIYLLDPSNSAWQNYIANENNKVYQHLAFDGYHMDQLGDRGDTYRYDGSRLYLNQTYKPFIEQMKQASPDKNVVMNAVNQYGQQNISSGMPDFLYTEVWDPFNKYADLVSIIKQNNIFSNHAKNTVLAAYMNYDLADYKGYFNTPAVLMTNAVIFAHGGAHLELGEHMLGKEYFPNNNLMLKPDLKSALIDYYDFLTAYENLLRDGGEFNQPNINSLDGKMSFSASLGSMGSVCVVGKEFENKQVIHLLNHTDSKTQEWRDNKAQQSTPRLIKNSEVEITISKKVKGVWLASPDIIGGASRSLQLVQSGNKVSFTVPELKYWSMIVLEY